MADIRIKDLPTTATQTASDDFIALDGTVNGTRKIDASAPSFKTSVTSPSIVAPAATALTLTGGSTGASLVLGATTTSSVTVSPKGSGSFDISGSQAVLAARIFNTSTADAAPRLQLIRSTTGSARTWTFGVGEQSTGDLDIVDSTASAIRARLTTTGNLLIGTTTDMTGSGGLRVAGTTASTSTITGALQVAGGIAVAKSSYFEDSVSGASAATFFTNHNAAISTGHVYINSNEVAAPFDSLRVRQAGSGNILKLVGTAAAGTVATVSSSGVLSLLATTPSTSTTNGALVVAGGVGVSGAIYNGSNIVSTGSFITSATGAALQLTGANPSIEIGAAGSSNSPLIDFHSSASSTDYDARIVASGGTASAGAGTLSLTAATINIPGTTPSTGVGSGALQVAGGIYAGAASVFGSTVTVGGVTTLAANSVLAVKAGVGTAAVYVSDSATATPGATSPGIYFASSTRGGYYRNASGVLQLIDESAPGAGDGSVRTSVNLSTGAATFAGAVTVNGTGTSSFSGSVRLPNAGTLIFYTAAAASATGMSLTAGDVLKVGQSNANITSTDIYGGTGNVTINAGASLAATFSPTTATFAGIIKPQQATTAGAPAYVKGAIYFDTTLNKLRVGGATAWETITSA